MKEKEITNMVTKFERLIGPVAGSLASEVASDIGILKGDAISPPSQKDYDSFLKRLSERYAKILGKPLVQNMIAEAQKNSR